MKVEVHGSSPGAIAAFWVTYEREKNVFACVSECDEGDDVENEC